MTDKGSIKTFLNVCRSVDSIKFNGVIKRYNLSQSAINKYLNDDNYEDMIGIKQLEILSNAIYNNCGFVVDMYKEIILNENIG